MVRVQSFDLPSGWPGSGTRDMPYIHRAHAWLQRRFPGRLNLTLGDSLHTVPALSRTSTVRCDLTFVDGGHTFGHSYADMRSLRCAARPHSLMLADDCMHDQGSNAAFKVGVRAAWHKMVNESRVVPLASVAYGGHSGCLGQYAASAPAVL